MKKNVIKINENTLRQIVTESVKNVLKEEMDNAQYATEMLAMEIVAFAECLSKGEVYKMSWNPYRKEYNGQGGDPRKALEIALTDINSPHVDVPEDDPDQWHTFGY